MYDTWYIVLGVPGSILLYLTTRSATNKECKMQSPLPVATVVEEVWIAQDTNWWHRSHVITDIANDAVLDSGLVRALVFHVHQECSIRSCIYLLFLYAAAQIFRRLSRVCTMALMRLIPLFTMAAA